jgi:hypothetical protein
MVAYEVAFPNKSCFDIDLIDVFCIISSMRTGHPFSVE